MRVLTLKIKRPHQELDFLYMTEMRQRVSLKLNLIVIVMGESAINHWLNSLDSAGDR